MYRKSEMVRDPRQKIAYSYINQLVMSLILEYLIGMNVSRSKLGLEMATGTGFGWVSWVAYHTVCMICRLFSDFSPFRFSFFLGFLVPLACGNHRHPTKKTASRRKQHQLHHHHHHYRCHHPPRTTARWEPHQHHHHRRHCPPRATTRERLLMTTIFVQADWGRLPL